MGPRFAPNIASQALLGEDESEEVFESLNQIKISENLKIELDHNSSQAELNHDQTQIVQ